MWVVDVGAILDSPISYEFATEHNKQDLFEMFW